MTTEVAMGAPRRGWGDHQSYHVVYEPQRVSYLMSWTHSSRTSLIQLHQATHITVEEHNTGLITVCPVLTIDVAPIGKVHISVHAGLSLLSGDKIELRVCLT
jgi:hypothetical protein